MSRGQAAMEYLMTYGWALLAIVIVIALLLFLNPFGTGESCVAEPGFDCGNPLPYLKSNGELEVTLRNGQATAINVTGYNCTVEAKANSFTSYSPSLVINTGGQAKLTGQCPGVSPGQLFQGYLHVRYHYVNEPGTTQQRVIPLKVRVKASQ